MKTPIFATLTTALILILNQTSDAQVETIQPPPAQPEVIPAYEPIPQHTVSPDYAVSPGHAVPHHAVPHSAFSAPEFIVTCTEPGWCGVVFAQGALKEQLENTPIELRPYRPFHFYGNTVRRLHYRGQAMPTVQDVQDATRALLGL